MEKIQTLTKEDEKANLEYRIYSLGKTFYLIQDLRDELSHFDEKKQQEYNQDYLTVTENLIFELKQFYEQAKNSELFAEEELKGLEWVHGWVNGNGEPDAKKWFEKYRLKRLGIYIPNK